MFYSEALWYSGEKPGRDQGTWCTDTNTHGVVDSLPQIRNPGPWESQLEIPGNVSGGCLLVSAKGERLMPQALWTEESWVSTLHSRRVEERIFPSPALIEQFLSANARVRRGSCIRMGHT